MGIVGAGLCGLSLTLNLHRRGLQCRVYERAPELTELGVYKRVAGFSLPDVSAA